MYCLVFKLLITDCIQILYKSIFLKIILDPVARQNCPGCKQKEQYNSVHVCAVYYPNNCLLLLIVDEDLYYLYIYQGT